MVGCVLESFFYCLFWKVKNDSVCLNASIVNAVQMCCLVAFECCRSSTCSTAREGCRPLVKSRIFQMFSSCVLRPSSSVAMTSTTDTSGLYSTCSQDQLMVLFSHWTPQNRLNCLLSSPLTAARVLKSSHLQHFPLLFHTQLNTPWKSFVMAFFCSSMIHVSSTLIFPSVPFTCIWWDRTNVMNDVTSQLTCFPLR